MTIKVKTNRPRFVAERVDSEAVDIRTTSGDGSTVTQADIDTAVAAALNTYMPGAEMGAAERFTPYTSTATSIAEATTDISGLTVTVIGKGRPVDVEAIFPALTHSVANTVVTIALFCNGSGVSAQSQLFAAESSKTSAGNGSGSIIKRRMVLTNGVSYTFSIRTFSYLVAGTTTLYAATPYQPMQLNVTGR